MGHRLGVVAVVTLALVGCGEKHPANRVTYVADDPRMNAAMDKARSTVKMFIAALKSPKAVQSAFSIKAGLTEGGNTEHVWLTPVVFDGSKFTGTVNNEPEKVKSVKWAIGSRWPRTRSATGCTSKTGGWSVAKPAACCGPP